MIFFLLLPVSRENAMNGIFFLLFSDMNEKQNCCCFLIAERMYAFNK